MHLHTGCTAVACCWVKTSFSFCLCTETNDDKTCLFDYVAPGSSFTATSGRDEFLPRGESFMSAPRSVSTAVSAIAMQQRGHG